MTSATLPETSPVRLRSPRDVLAAVPYLLGYRPAECVVVAGVAPDGRLPLLARAALDDLAHPDDGERVVRTLASRTADVGVDRSVVAVWSARGVEPGTPLRRGVDRLVDALDAVADVDPWLVTPHGYRGLDCDDPTCCPPEGHPLDQLAAGEVSAAFVLSGRAVARTQAEAFRIARAPDASRALAGRAASRWERAGERARAGGAKARWRSEGLAAWDEARRHAATELRVDGSAGVAAGGVRLPPALLGRIGAALADTTVRDAVLLTLVPGAEQAAHRTAGGASADEVGAATADAVARVVDPRVAVLPDEDVVGPARAVLEAVVAHVARRHQAPALTLLALLAWWRGDGGLAAHRVQAALALDPGHRLAVLVRSVLTAGLPPGWVRRAAARARGAAPSDRPSDGPSDELGEARGDRSAVPPTREPGVG
ncbi:DUF4192 domain-containing protein [Isoptericola variabilis]|uniref:DUF4192 domain-containing protein n=1 Tax=Isoptericola variabilis (strain 225) TaxID=743718 RepID=F6FWI0_ISOV2|nr:DUF4192 domain-containing protein [Isoptericola variabilis]AEG44554.1 hypothetical protein Isova_1808 [Isoptericola variabilis 225]TWH26529.1 uncharacterized protein DUF4192 [Isoptericola variabilis J7]